MTPRDPVTSDGATVTIPHWGITMRHIYGVALSSWPDRQPGQVKKFSVSLNGVEIATINVKEHDNSRGINRS